MAGSEREVVRKADTCMEAGDSNKDGFLTYDDFVRIATRFPKVLFPVRAHVARSALMFDQGGRKLRDGVCTIPRTTCRQLAPWARVLVREPACSDGDGIDCL